MAFPPSRGKPSTPTTPRRLRQAFVQRVTITTPCIHLSGIPNGIAGLFYDSIVFLRFLRRGARAAKSECASRINSLLSGEEVVTDLTYLNTEHLGTGEADRKAVFDVYCQNEKGEKFLVEMQRGEQRGFKDRSIYYATFPIREQGQKGEWNYELKAVYIIGILNFTFDETDDNYFHHEVKLMDKRKKMSLRQDSPSSTWKCPNSIRSKTNWTGCSKSGCSC